MEDEWELENVRSMKGMTRNINKNIKEFKVPLN